MSQTTTVQGLRAASPESQLPIVAPGFGSLQGFELMQRAARLLSSSTLVPVAYRQTIEKLDRYGNVKESRENPNALANSVVALNMAQRMGADPLMVMQNLYIVEGRPSWSSQWIIAAINGCGRFSPLRFRIESRGEREVEYKSTYWENNQRHTKVEKVKINDKVCVAWAIEKETGEVIESPAVSIEMAVLEGWYTKNGSKWQTMDEVMLRYRTASFFGKLYAPELLMGLQTVEEAQDIIEATTAPDGTISVNVDELRQATQPAQRQPAAAQANATDLEVREPAATTDTAPAKAQAEAGDPAQSAATAAPASQTQQADQQGVDAGLDPAKVEHQIQNAKSIDVLDLASDSIDGIDDLGERARLHQLYQSRRLSMTAAAQRGASNGGQQAAGAPTPRRRMQAPE
ncbi:hypothetical protein [Achromobacter ruhlandii]|uniref:hypothetical protein n=1 Tax=Achromobacter ruhlandii TaxID=72557 RepID=UPI0006C69939|nr:hypothetical protein [Achromobacter ruhlandii]AVC43135.1 hypothetical protein AL520_27150 [Achromobacter xylosoxidans]CUJ39152.1 Uncharacterised protein [Achromobacter ruhlandii]